MFAIYLKYIRNVDITLGEEKWASARLRKYKVREASEIGAHPPLAPVAPTAAPVADPNAGLETASTPVK